MTQESHTCIHVSLRKLHTTLENETKFERHHQSFNEIKFWFRFIDCTSDLVNAIEIKAISANLTFCFLWQTISKSS